MQHEELFQLFSWGAW